MHEENNRDIATSGQHGGYCQGQELNQSPPQRDSLESGSGALGRPKRLRKRYPEKQLTVAICADRLGVSHNRVIDYIKLGRLAHTRHGKNYRVPESSLKRLVRLPAGRPRSVPFSATGKLLVPRTKKTLHQETT